MRNFIRILAWIPCAFFVCVFSLDCAFNKPLEPQAAVSVPGMRKILANGKSFLQGANDSLASIDDLEKPPMEAGFSYDFWIDTTEVTQKEYQEVTGSQPLPDSATIGRGGQFPVSYVSWYDAVLFCNLKSKKNNCDTVYSYFGKKSLNSGSVFDMTGLRIQYDKNGYRLPTESEWEFCAREGTSTIPSPGLADSSQARAVAWFDQNSSNTTHPVAQLKGNKFGLYDMAGNVYEWTNDWKGPYAAETITNSIGAPLPNSYIERVMKGGSFKHGFIYLRPSRRGAVYPVTLSTTADFIGFRCACGIIPVARYCVADTTAIVTNPVDLVINDVTPFLGTTRARLVFTNVTGSARTLCFVDFNKAVPTIFEFTDMTNVFVPAISPDGKFAAFCNRGEGMSGPAQVSIRSLDSTSRPAWGLGADSAFVPRWRVDQLTRDTFLVYTNSSVDNASSVWPSTETILQQMTGGRPYGPPAVLIGNGSFHDGLSSSGQYVVTGYTRCVMRDLIDSWEHQLFVSPYNGKNASGSTQVCNVSISQDLLHPDRCMFLDFGCPDQISSLTQSTYGPHEYLFISEFAGTTLSWFKCPSGESSWDFPEWSNVAQFAVASARNGGDDAHAIYFVNLASGASTQVAQGTELENPGLWIDNTNILPPNFQLSLDSLGIYDDPLLSGDQVPFSFKMHYFWRRHASLNAVFVGSATGFMRY